MSQETIRPDQQIKPTNLTLENLTLTNDLNVDGMGYYDKGIVVNASGIIINATSIFPSLTEDVGSLHGYLSAEEPPHSHTVYLDASSDEGDLNLYNRVVLDNVLPNITSYTNLNYNSGTNKTTWRLFLSETPTKYAIVAISGYTQFYFNVGVLDGLLVGDIINNATPPAGTIMFKEIDTPTTPTNGYGLLYVYSGVLKYKDDNGNVYTVDLTPD